MTVGRTDANGAGSATGSAVTAKPDQQGAHATPPTTRAGQGSAASPGGTLSPVPMLPGQKAQGAQPLGVIFLIAAAMYFLVPADSLPTFFPGHETGLMRIRAKHGMLTGAIGVVLLGVSWFLGRR